MNYNILGYGIYLCVILWVILYVGNVLFTNGRHFCINSFGGNIQLADAVNRMLLSGYYLINIGYSVIILVIRDQILNTTQLLEILTEKIGTIILMLGIIHMLNLFVLTIVGKIKKMKSTIININQ